MTPERTGNKGCGWGKCPFPPWLNLKVAFNLVITHCRFLKTIPVSTILLYFSASKFVDKMPQFLFWKMWSQQPFYHYSRAIVEREQTQRGTEHALKRSMLASQASFLLQSYSCFIQHSLGGQNYQTPISQMEALKSKTLTDVSSTFFPLILQLLKSIYNYEWNKAGNIITLTNGARILWSIKTPFQWGRLPYWKLWDTRTNHQWKMRYHPLKGSSLLFLEWLWPCLTPWPLTVPTSLRFSTPMIRYWENMPRAYVLWREVKDLLLWRASLLLKETFGGCRSPG